MEQYEIRVQSGKVSRIHSCLQLNDHAAVRRARAIAKGSEGVEIWRGETCVYVQPPKALFPADHADV